MKKNISRGRKDEKGYTLLFAVLIASLTLAVGISILNISRKEFLIATSTRDSALALYAADGGLECAIFSDSNGLFTDTTYTGTFGCNVPHSPIEYLRQNPPGGGVTDIFTFHAKFGGQGTSCAVIVASKTTKNGTLSTIIQSFGYNTGWNPDASLCSLGSAKRVERALQYTVF